MYRSGDIPIFSPAPMIIGHFSLLLDRPAATSRSILVSFNESAPLESFLPGMTESPSFSLWALASVFTFLKDYGCVPRGGLLPPTGSSHTVSLHSQATASFSAASFLMKKRHGTLLSHLPMANHASVEHTFLTSLFLVFSVCRGRVSGFVDPGII